MFKIKVKLGYPYCALETEVTICLPRAPIVGDVILMKIRDENLKETCVPFQLTKILFDCTKSFIISQDCKISAEGRGPHVLSKGAQVFDPSSDCYKDIS
jgi:hypothetical protein